MYVPVLFSVTVGMVRGASQGCIGAEDEQQLREEGGIGFAEDMKGMRADAILVHSSRRGGGTARVARGGGGWALYDLLQHRTSGTYEGGGGGVCTCACAMETRQDILSDTTKANATWRGRGDRTRLG